MFQYFAFSVNIKMHMGELNNGENFNVKMKMKMNDVLIDVSPLWKG
jgi:hypothetical protein